MQQDLTDDAELRRKLDELAHLLRPLHKALVDLVRVEYEKSHGPVAGPVPFFHLLTSDPFFAWLRPMSALMAEVDELHDQKEPVALDEVKALRVTLEELVSDRGQQPAPDSFVVRYLDMLQQHPEVVMLHARLRRALDQL